MGSAPRTRLGQLGTRLGWISPAHMTCVFSKLKSNFRSPKGNPSAIQTTLYFPISFALIFKRKLCNSLGKDTAITRASSSIIPVPLNSRVGCCKLAGNPLATDLNPTESIFVLITDKVRLAK